MSARRPASRRLRPLAALLVLLGGGVCALAIQHGPAAAAPPRIETCPTSDSGTDAALDASSPASALQRSRPTALQLCLIGQKTAAASHGVILGATLAATVDRIIDAGRARPTSTRACPPPGATSPLQTFLRFYVPSKRGQRVVGMLLCPRSSALVTWSERIEADHDALSLLWEDANTGRSPKGKPATPAVVGLSLKQAVRVAAKATTYFEGTLGVSFGGEWIDRDVAPGTVLLQGPWKGEMQMGLAVEVLVAVPPSPPCRVGELKSTFTAFAAQPPGTTQTALFDLRNVGKQFCRLGGIVRLVGVNAQVQAVTQVATVDTPTGLVLSPDDSAIPHGPYTPATPIYATVSLGSPDAAQCPEPLVDPSAWDVTVQNGSLRMPNVVTPATPNGLTSLAVCPTVISPGAMSAG